MDSIIYSCASCQGKYVGLRQYVFHVKKYGSENTLRFQCPYCLSKLQATGFKKHLRNHELNGDPLPNNYHANNEDFGLETILNNCEGADHTQPTTSQNIHDNLVVENQQFQNIFTENNFNENVSKFILKSMVHFYCKPNNPFSNAEEITEMVTDLMNFTSENLKEEILKCSTLEEATNFVNQVEFDFDKFRSMYMLTKHLEETKVLFHPKKFVINNRTVHYFDDMSNEVDVETYHGIIMPIDDQIKAFLQLPGILKAIITNQNKYQSVSSSKPISHFCQGKLWREIVQRNVGNTLIPIMIYNDDFTVDSGIGPHSSGTSISGFYYQFPSLPAHLKSKLQYIFVAMLALSKHLKECSPDSSLYMLLHVFTRLESNGLVIVDETGKSHKIYIVLTNVLGDNLGIHTICGFTKGFNSGFYCRFCLTHKSVCQYLSDNKNIEIRTIDRYEEMIRDGTHVNWGINRRCILNDLENFHVLINYTADVMHDLMLGVLKYDLKVVLKFYTDSGLLNLEALNRRIRNWEFGCKETIRISPIMKAHLSSNLQMNAKEVWFVVENLPVLLNGLVPDDEVFQFILLMHDLQDACLQPEFSEEDLKYLDLLIKEHHSFYKNYFLNDLTPKFHFMLHYTEVIRRCGPLKELMCFRLEAKHQELKSYSNVSHNRRNVPLSMAKKQTFRFADTILNFNPECLSNFVSSIKKLNMSMFDVTILDSVKMFLKQNNKIFDKFACAEKITYKGTTFARGEYLIINEDSAALIKGIIIADFHVIVLYNYVTIFYEENLKSYAVLEEDESFILYNFINNFKYIPVPLITSMGKRYIKKLKRY